MCDKSENMLHSSFHKLPVVAQTQLSILHSLSQEQLSQANLAWVTFHCGDVMSWNALLLLFIMMVMIITSIIVIAIVIIIIVVIIMCDRKKELSVVPSRKP